MSKEVQVIPAAPVPTFGVVDMTVSKKELLKNMLEIHEIKMQKAVEETEDQIEELQDFDKLVTKDVKAKIQKEVQNNSSVKSFVNSKNKLFASAHQANSEKSSVVVEASYRNNDVNVAVRLTEKFTTVYFGTSESRHMGGTIDLNKISATAKGLHKKMEARLVEIEKLEKKATKQRKELKDFTRNSSQAKHDFNKALLNQSADGKKILAELAKFEKSFKK